MRKITFIAAALLASTALMVAPATIAQEVTGVEFPQDVASTEIAGSIKGDAYADYTVAGKAGQVLSVNLEAESLSVNFNVMPEGNPSAIYIGSINGPEFAGRLPIDGNYTIRVYQMGAAADGDNTNEFSLAIGLDAVTLPEQEDAVVEGTNYNATGQLDCSFEANPEVAPCDFGVIRNGDGSASVFVTTPSEFVRELSFGADGDVSAPNWDKPVQSERDDDVTVVSINDGEEVYRIPDIVVLGD